jgi:hypothetical protein
VVDLPVVVSFGDAHAHRVLGAASAEAVDALLPGPRSGPIASAR